MEGRIFSPGVFFAPQLCHVSCHFYYYLLDVVVRARYFYDLCGNFWCSSCCREYHEVLSSVLSWFALHCTRINVRCKSHFDKAFMYFTCWLPCCEVCLLALKNCTDLPFIGLWCDFNCLWSIKGFTEWFESVTSHKTRRGYSPSSVQDPHSICSSSFFFGLISCFFFLRRCFSFVKLVTLVDTFAVPHVWNVNCSCQKPFRL